MPSRAWISLDARRWRASGCTYLVPCLAPFIPLFALMSMLHLLDSLSGLTFVYLGADVPFATWLLMGYFRSVPVELEEAALVVTAVIVSQRSSGWSCPSQCRP